jgi:hypothetical protein
MFPRLSELTTAVTAPVQVTEARREGDLADLIEKWCDANKLYHFEGERGQRNFEKLVRVLDSNYGSLSEFLSDNSGAIQAMIEWIGSQRSSEWVSNMQDAVGPDEDDGDDDGDDGEPQR